LYRLKTKQYFESKNISNYDFLDFFKTYYSQYWKDFTDMYAKVATVFINKLKKALFMTKLNNAFF
jgi:hypothetical protein